MMRSRSREFRVSTRRSRPLASLLWAVAAIAGSAWAGAPPETEVQGLYEETGTDAAGAFKLEARVVAQGKGIYKVLVRQRLGGDKIARVDLVGKTIAEAVTFAGKAGEVQWSAAYAAGAVKGAYSAQSGQPFRSIPDTGSGAFRTGRSVATLALFPWVVRFVLSSVKTPWLRRGAR